MAGSERLSCNDFEAFLFVTGLLGEAGVGWMAVGGNELLVPAGSIASLDGALARDLAMSVRNPIAVVDAPPGVDTGADVVDVTASATGELPPRAGPGATRDAWAAAARDRGLVPPDGAGREEIIAMIDAQEAPGGS